VETAETSGELLSTVHVSSGECRRQKEEGEEEEQWLAVEMTNDRGQW
jgi:hypothetical protein